MATATKKPRAPRQVPRAGARVSESAPMEFLVFQDNGGRYRWTILASGGEQLAQSPSFASYEDAREAAALARDGAGSARLEAHEAAAVPVDLIARRAALASDDLDAERWLDEGGAYSAAVAAELPPPR
jgi:uncharacterized protein YegP (UPF0339 family)